MVKHKYCYVYIKKLQEFLKIMLSGAFPEATDYYSETSVEIS